MVMGHMRQFWCRKADNVLFILAAFAQKCLRWQPGMLHEFCDRGYDVFDWLLEVLMTDA